MIWLFGFGLFLLALMGYCIIPNYIGRNLSKTVIKRINTEKKIVALTFDDGPDCKYTQAFLDVLDAKQVKATFFLIGQKVIKHKDITLRINSKGHDIGCHSFSHVHSWLMSPWKTNKDMNATYNAIYHTIKVKPTLFRAPWGMLNLFTVKIAKQLGLKTVYYDIEAQDWDESTSATHIIDTVVSKVKPGSIVLLHDSGGDKNAPSNTLQALPAIIDKLSNNGYKFLTITEMEEAMNLC